MNKQKSNIPLLAAILLSMGAMGVAQDRGSYEKEYSVITDHNLFLKELHKPRPPTTQRSGGWGNRDGNEAQREVAEKNFVLRGIVIEDNELRAYIENARTGAMLRLVPGEPVATGRVAEIVIDAIRYEANGQLIWIEIGHDLTGARVMDVPRPSYAPITTQPTGTATGTGDAGAPASTDGLSVEEQMRRRRSAMNGGTPPAAPGATPAPGGTPPATPNQEGPRQ